MDLATVAAERRHQRHHNQSLMYWMYDVEMSVGLGLIAIGGIFSTFGPLVAAFGGKGFRLRKLYNIVRRLKDRKK